MCEKKYLQLKNREYKRSCNCKKMSRVSKPTTPSSSSPVGSWMIGDSFAEAALTAAVFAGSTKVLYPKEAVFGKPNLMNAGVLAGSVFANGIAMPWITNLLPQLAADSINYIVNPLMCGMIYSLLTTYVTKSDNRGMLVKMLHGAAANMVGKNLETPIRNAIRSS
jgi:hypothetical protein